MKSTINTAYPNAKTGDGVFTDLQNFDVPWKGENVADSLDRLYENRSGDKEISRIVSNHLNNGAVTVNGRSVIALSLLIMYKHQWERLYETLSAEYDPIANYDMTETESGTNSAERDNSNSGTHTETGTRTYTDSGTVTDSGAANTETGVYGFNSTNAVASDTADNTTSNQETRNLTRLETPNISESDSGTSSGTESGEFSRTLTRKGNIGVTTSQQLLQSEISLWQWSFFNQVFEDIDKILTLQVY